MNALHFLRRAGIGFALFLGLALGARAGQYVSISAPASVGAGTCYEVDAWASAGFGANIGIYLYKNGALVGSDCYYVSYYSADSGPQTVYYHAQFQDTNYWDDDEANVRILASTPTTFSVNNFTYDGTAKTVTITPNPSNATFTAGGTLTATTAGTYTATASATGSFSGSNSNLTWTIYKATPVISWSVPSTMSYGTALPAATANIPGTFSYSANPGIIGPGTVLNAGGYVLTATFTPTDTTNYNTATTSVTVAVGQVGTTILLSNLVQNWDGNGKEVTVTTIPTGLATSVEYDDTSRGGAIYSPNCPNSVGQYEVHATSTDPNYSGTSAYQTMLILPQVSCNSQVTLTYGTALNPSQLGLSSSWNCDYSYSRTMGSILNVGNYTLVVTFSPHDAPAAAVTRTINITVNPAPLTITAGSASKTYGAANPGLSASGTGFVNGDTIAVVSGLQLNTSATAASPVGNYAIVPSGASAANYSISYVNGTLAVNPAVLTITANNASKIYSVANPSFTASYNGFVNGDTSSVVSGLQLNTAATSASPVGNYAISPSGASAANYSINYGSGMLTVTQAALIITANNASKTYGGANPGFSASYSGFVNGDTASVVSGLQISSTATTSSAAGTTYAITPSGASAANYSISYGSGTLTVTQAALTITPNAASKTYGAANPGFSASYSGFVNGDTSTVVSGLSLSTTAGTGSPVGTYAITASGATATNYSISYGSGILTVTQAPLKITPNAANKSYSAANPAFSASYSGLVNGDTSAVVSGLTLTTTATASSAVGAYPITGSGATASNYSISYNSGTLTINKVGLTITPNNASKTYGQANPGFSASYSGFVNGDTASVVSGLTLSTTATAASPVNTYPIAGSGATATNYTISYINGTLTVNKASLTITANNASKVYGTANPSFSAAYSGFVNSDTSAVVSGLALATSATTASGAGTYAITPAGAGAANYAITYVNGTLTISKAPLTITATNASKVYGAANPSFSATYSGFVNSDTSTVVSGLALGTSATTASGAGTYAITPAGASAANYDITYVNGTLTISKAPLTITAKNASKVYGAGNPSFSATYSGFVNSDTSAVVSGLAISTSATTASGAGTYAITPSGASAANYAITYVNGTLTISKAPLTITAANASKVYGAVNPSFSASYSGFVNSDTSTVVSGLAFGTSATASSGVGSYAITPSGASAANYSISYVNGTLTVSRAALKVTANNASRAYGAANPAFSATYTGFVNSDTSSVVSGLVFGSTATATSAAGTTYAITPSGASAANYSISYVNGTLTIAKASLVISVVNASRGYGAANPTFSATYSGFVNSETSSVVTGLVYSCSATTTSNAGTYAITPSGATAANYSISYVNGTLTITKAVLKITAANASKVYGAANPSFSATYSGFLNSDTSAVVSGLVFGTSEKAASGAGTYAITPSGATATNYAITFVNGTLTVTPAALKITANNASRAYGAANPSFSATYTGLVNSDTSSVVSGLKFSTTAAATSGAGSTYPITPSGATAINYAITYANGTLTIAKAALKITANNASRVYGSANPSFSATYSGLVNGETSTVVSGLVYACSATSTSNVSTYAITPSGASATNYTITLANGTLTVTQATPAITWGTPAPIAKSTPLSDRQLNASSPVAGAFTYTPAIGTTPAVGTVTLSASFKPADTINYVSRSVSVNLAVYDPAVDTDHDGIADGWEAAYGLNSASAADALADPDGDGLTNVAEYNLGTNPLVSDNPASASLPKAFTALELGDVTKTATYAVGITAGKLSVDKSGAAIYSIPLAVSPGTAGLEPKLALNYSSQGGNGVAGFGWSLSGLSAITRGPQTLPVDNAVHGVDFTVADRFYLDGQRLIAISGEYGANGTEYRTENESFSQIISYGSSGTGPLYFKVRTKAGLIMEFGNTPKSRLQPTGLAEIMSWSASKVSDTAGNYMSFDYTQGTDASGANTMVLDRINYTGHDGATTLLPYASVRFEYEDRSDSSFSYVYGARIALNKRLKNIKIYSSDTTIIKTYTLNYTPRAGTGRSILTSLLETGMDGKAYPAMSFDYDSSPTGWDPLNDSAWQIPMPIAVNGIDIKMVGSAPTLFVPQNNIVGSSGFIDINGDGKPDIVRDSITYLNTPLGWVADSRYILPADAPLSMSEYDGKSVADTGTRFVDLNGDGFMDVIRSYRRKQDSVVVSCAYLNTPSNLTIPNSTTIWVPAPGFLLNQYQAISQWDGLENGFAFVDVNGDGLVDLIWNTRVYFGALLNTGSGWVSAPGYGPQRFMNPIDPEERAIFIDLNGDGLVDELGVTSKLRFAAINTGTGWKLDNSGVYAPAFLPAFASKSVEAVDLNGDGLTDLVWGGGAAINTGHGWIDASAQFTPAYFLGTNPLSGSVFTDINGDGIPDQVFSRCSVGTGNADYMTASPAFSISTGSFLGTGTGWVTDNSRVLPYPISNSRFSNGTGVNYIDIDGDGMADEVYSNSWAYVTSYLAPTPGGSVSSPVITGSSSTWDRGIYLNKAHSADRLVTVTSGLGVKAKVNYAPLTKPLASNPSLYTKGTDLLDIPESSRASVSNVIRPIYVVSSVDFDDCTGGVYTLQYQYGELRTHLTRGSLGFGWMKTLDTRSNISSTTQFRQDYPFIGLASDTITQLPSGKTLSKSHSDYEEGALPWPGTHFAYCSGASEQSWDLNGVYLSGSVTSSKVDSYGNALTIETKSLAEDKTPEAYRKVTTSTYDNYTDKWFLGRLSHATVDSYAPDLGNGLPTQMTRTSAFTYYSTTTGFLNTETVEPDSVGNQENLTLTTTYEYDAFGNKQKATVTGGGMTSRTVSTVYDAIGRFPDHSTNAPNQTETYIYDPCFGGITSLTGPNKLTTTWQYDGMGRKILESRPCTNPSIPSYTATVYSWCGASAPSGAVFQIETITAGATPSLAFYDSSGRVIYGLGINGGLVDGAPRVVGARTWFDNYGRAFRASLPFYYTGGEPSPVIASETSYDLLNRPKTILTADDPDPDSGSTTPIYQTSSISYNGRETSTTNPKLQVTRSLKNSQGWVVETFTNYTGTGPEERGHVKFAYDPLGQLCTTTVYNNGDASSVSTKLSYDLRGRKTGMIDPDMGTWSYHYDAAGELLTQTDATKPKAQTVTMTYDALGRVLTRSELEGTTTWTYDTAANGIGKLASVAVVVTDTTKEKNYAETYAYDALGRSSGLTRTIDGTAYSQGQTYDDFSRPLVTVYPGGFQVGNRYNALGFLTQVYDARPSSNVGQGDTPAGYVYWWANGYDIHGAVDASSLGNGATLDRIFAPISGRLTGLASGRGISTTPEIQNIAYVYDSLGNAVTRKDTAPELNRKETFRYDGLNRLTYSDVNGAAAINVGYDALGNIKSKTNAGTSYLYGERGFGPHAVTTVSGGPAASSAFTYDFNGNLTWDGQRSITWTSYNQVKTITKSSSSRKTTFWFGAGHERVMQQDTGGATTTYVGSLLEVVKTGSLTEKKHYIFTPAGRVAVRTTRTPGSGATTYETRFLHQDALGSVTAVTNEFGAVEQRFTFDAWGLRTQTVNTRAAGSGGTVTRGFTDHEHLDDFGLIHMNGRVYDPLLGRFMSADPFVQAPGDSQSCNRYSYCMNNPVNGTDPSGYRMTSSEIIPMLAAIIVTVVVTVATMGTGTSGCSTFWGAFSTAGSTAGTGVATATWNLGLTAVVAGGAAGGSTSAFMSSMINGGSLGDAFREGAVGGAWGGFTSLVAAGIGGAFDKAALGDGFGEAGWGGRALAHGGANGMISEVQGAEFRHGFYAGAFASAAAPLTHMIGGEEMDWHIAERTAIASAIGGTASALGGGKFANGALTGAFVHLFNTEGSTMPSDEELLKKVVFQGPLANDAKADLQSALAAGGVPANHIRTAIMLSNRVDVNASESAPGIGDFDQKTRIGTVDYNPRSTAYLAGNGKLKAFGPASIAHEFNHVYLRAIKDQYLNTHYFPSRDEFKAVRIENAVRAYYGQDLRKVYWFNYGPTDILGPQNVPFYDDPTK